MRIKKKNKQTEKNKNKNNPKKNDHFSKR